MLVPLKSSLRGMRQSYGLLLLFVLCLEIPSRLIVNGQAYSPLLGYYLRNTRGPFSPPSSNLGEDVSSRPRFIRVPSSPYKYFTSPFHPRVQGHSKFRANDDLLNHYEHHLGGIGGGGAGVSGGVGGHDHDNSGGGENHQETHQITHDEEDPTFTPYAAAQALNIGKFFDLIKANLKALREEELQELQDAEEHDLSSESSSEAKWVPMQAGIKNKLQRFFGDSPSSGFSPLRAHYTSNQRPSFGLG